MKKKTANQILFFVIILLLFSCNSGIFIEDFLPEVPQAVTISETDNTKEIHFNANNWALINITPLTTVPSINYSTVKGYSLDGKPVSFPFMEREEGILHYRNDFVDFQVEKRSGNQLKVVLNENLMNDNVEMLVTVGNEYKMEEIRLLLAPTQKYQIDSVVYDWSRFTFYEGILEQMESITIDNRNASMPVKLYLSPYKNSVHKVHFYDSSMGWDKELFTYLLGSPLPQITIPDIENSKPVLKNTKVPFGISRHNIEAGLDKEANVEVTVDGGDKRNVVVYNEMEKYSVPYKVYLSSSHTNKKRVFSGELYSSRPIDYLIFKERVDENEE